VTEAALAAVMAELLEFAGVDVPEDPGGRPWVLQANFPCYFPQAQLVAGVDVAGAMVEFLVAKARCQGP
jgi:glutathione synthase/RimK-type ligase-like ATP-grasp enzyme